MRKEDLEESGFERIFIPKEQSGNKNDYYYYSYAINADVILTSNESDEITNNQWKVYEHSWGVAMTDVDDVITLINLFKKWSKIPL
jgi:hypothetical protein